MDASHQTEAQWQSCKPGTLTSRGAAAKASGRRRRLALQVAGAGCAIAAVGFGVWLASHPGSIDRREFHYGGIACRDVRANMADYQMRRLPDELTRRIAAHLEQCPACQKVMRTMQHQQPPAVSRILNARPCDCPLCRQRQALAALAGPRLSRAHPSLVGVIDRTPSQATLTSIVPRTHEP